MDYYGKARAGEQCPTPALRNPLMKGTFQSDERERRFTAIPFQFRISGSEYSQNVKVPVSYDFELVQLTAYFERDFYLQIRDDFRSEEVFYSPVRGSLITGDGRLPYVLPTPYIFNGGTTITVTVADTVIGSPPEAVVEIVLIGNKLSRK